MAGPGRMVLLAAAVAAVLSGVDAVGAPRPPHGCQHSLMPTMGAMFLGVAQLVLLPTPAAAQSRSVRRRRFSASRRRRTSSSSSSGGRLSGTGLIVVVVVICAIAAIYFGIQCCAARSRNRSRRNNAMLPDNIDSVASLDTALEDIEPNPVMGSRVACLHLQSYEVEGTVRWVGVWNGVETLGVELETDDGDCAGDANGVIYFRTLPNHGVFVHSSAVRVIEQYPEPSAPFQPPPPATAPPPPAYNSANLPGSPPPYTGASAAGAAAPYPTKSAGGGGRKSLTEEEMAELTALKATMRTCADGDVVEAASARIQEIERRTGVKAHESTV